MGFPGSLEMLSQQQLLHPASSITSQTDPPGWAVALPTIAWGSTEQLMSLRAGHVPDGAPLPCLCMATS